MTAVGIPRTKPVRVVVVDDSEDIRFLLRMQFSRDDRFEVVGEARDGREAILVSERQQPELLILDQQMPVMTGTEVMAEIRRVSPETAIILYTAHSDTNVYQAAFDAGALDVLEKVAVGTGFVDRLVDVLIERTSGPRATMEIRVGPVSSTAARAWIANTTRVLDAVESHPGELEQPIPDDVLELFRSFLRQWEAVAASTDEFRWVARSNPSDAKHIVTHWASIDLLTDEQLDRLGISWAPPEAAPFFSALTSGVIEALNRHEETTKLAARVSELWANHLDKS